ncbi:hypothetical protein DID75_05605 [Candidatus Marinamargulisbacteria bacterium SCGC AG-410-N11]|nr:hypothetical protein DID75_05605 [Candidatus Marinamargulisbacteria bacterium SCGC AG-410-N11]
MLDRSFWAVGLLNASYKIIVSLRDMSRKNEIVNALNKVTKVQNNLEICKVIQLLNNNKKIKPKT